MNQQEPIMKTRSVPAVRLPRPTSASRESRVYSEGIIAGLAGAATIAVWFFLLDVLNGRPFYTPMVLGTALFSRAGELVMPPEFSISFETVLMYTAVHTLVFCAVGGIAAKLIDLAENDASLGFGILLLFVVFEFGFIAVAFVFAEPVLHALTWSAILVGNLLAAGAMAGYFWQHHPGLIIRP
jgi:hypothetical protein